jgi:hypothetical protein
MIIPNSYEQVRDVSLFSSHASCNLKYLQGLMKAGFRFLAFSSHLKFCNAGQNGYWFYRKSLAFLDESCQFKYIPKK